MSTDSSELTLEKVAEFHTQLVRLNDAGIVFDLADPNASNRNFKDELDRILAHLATEQRANQSLEDVLLGSEQIPATYRTALVTWVRSHGSVDALSTLHRPALERVEVSNDYRMALVQPQIIAAMVYVCTIFLLLTTATHLESIYNQVRMPPSWPLRCVLFVRNTLPIWGPLLPLAYLAFLWWLMRGSIANISWLPGRRASLKTSSAGQYAANLSNLIQLETPTPKALALVGPWSAIGKSDSSQPASILPPVLRWAMSRIAPSSSNPDATNPPIAKESSDSEALQFAAGIYATMQRYQVEQRRAWLPLVLGMTFGGGLVLLYCMALFAPMAELLKDLMRT